MFIIGLGNPGKEYENTRHNSGREAALYFAKKNDFPAFELNKKANALVAEREAPRASARGIFGYSALRSAEPAVASTLLRTRLRRIPAPHSSTALQPWLSAKAGKIGKEKVVLILPETFMNKSGNAVAGLIKPKKEMKNTIVLHDDIDIPLGKIKISYGKNSGGHKGVESVMRALKTKNFVRIRIGVCPKRKPDHKEQMKFIVGKWKPAEQEFITKSFKRAAKTLETIITNSLERAMSEANQ